MKIITTIDTGTAVIEIRRDESPGAQTILRITDASKTAAAFLTPSAAKAVSEALK